MDAGEIKAGASRALASGDFARAAALYSTYCASAPTDRQSWLRMGDAWARAGNRAKAIDAYLAAAEGFAEDGFLARAIAASKLVLQLDPGHPRMQRILAGLYTQRRTPVRARVPPPPGTPHPASGTAADVRAPSAQSTSPEPAERRWAERVAPGPAERTLEAALSPARPAPRFDELSLDDSPQGLQPSVLHEVERVAGSLAEVSVPPPPPSPPSDPGVPQPPLFSDLPGAAFLELVERCPLLRFPAGGRILQQGTPGEDFFVVCQGRVVVLREEGSAVTRVAELMEGDFFGELALLSGAPRSASVDALVEDTQVLEIPGALLIELSKRHPSIATALRSFCRQRLLSNLMATSALFRAFPKAERRALVQRFLTRDVPAGETVVEEGMPSGGLYVVLAGDLVVSKGGHFVAALRQGDVFGEMALLSHGLATASVRALRQTSVLRLPPNEFARVAARHPALLEHLTEVRDARARENARLPLEDDDEAVLLV